MKSITIALVALIFSPIVFASSDSTHPLTISVSSDGHGSLGKTEIGSANQAGQYETNMDFAKNCGGGDFTINATNNSTSQSCCLNSAGQAMYSAVIHLKPGETGSTNVNSQYCDTLKINWQCGDKEKFVCKYWDTNHSAPPQGPPHQHPGHHN